MFAALRGILSSMRDPEAKPPHGAEADEALVARAKQGDRRAFDALVERHLPQVWRVVWRVIRHHEDTEDVVQEVFVSVHRALADFRGEAQFSTWLHRIAVTRALNHLDRAGEKLRRASDRLDGERDDGTSAIRPEVERAALARSGVANPLHALEAKDLMRRLAECLRTLPPPWRTVLALRDAEAMAYEEIATALKIEIGTVRSRLARARASLKDCIEGKAA
jgi:RNA polymerase sigma-70 factor (ECF subfamily)